MSRYQQNHIRTHFSWKYILAASVLSAVFPLLQEYGGMRIRELIPGNSITSSIPNSGYVLPLIELICTGLTVYVLIAYVHTRLGHLATVVVSSGLTFGIMSVVPYYRPKRLYDIIWILIMVLALIVMDVMRAMGARAYERMAATAADDGRHVYTVLSRRINANRDAYIALLADEGDMRSQRAVWGDVAVGDSIVLDEGDAVRARLPFIDMEYFLDVKKHGIWD